MRDFYCKVAWIAILMHSSSMYLQGKRTDGYAYSLYFFTLIFLVRELKQIRRYIKAKVLVDYVKEIWNWVDVAVICLVATSATILLLDDPSGAYNDRARTVLMVSNAFQLLHFASFLKKIFLPFATFVGGLMMVRLGVVGMQVPCILFISHTISSLLLPHSYSKRCSLSWSVLPWSC